MRYVKEHALCIFVCVCAEVRETGRVGVSINYERTFYLSCYWLYVVWIGSFCFLLFFRSQGCYKFRATFIRGIYFSPSWWPLEIPLKRQTPPEVRDITLSHFRGFFFFSFILFPFSTGIYTSSWHLERSDMCWTSKLLMFAKLLINDIEEYVWMASLNAVSRFVARNKHALSITMHLQL